MSCGEIAPKMKRGLNFANIGTPIVPVANRLVYSTATGLALLPTGNNGTLVTGGSGALSISSTLPNAVQLNITNLGIVTTGTWNSPGSITVNGANATGIKCIGAANLAIIQATLTSNTSGDHAKFLAEVAGTNSNSDPYIEFLNSNASTNISIGTDTSDSGAFKIDNGTTMGSNTLVKLTTGGQMTKPKQSSFMAYLGSADTNVTGDGTTYTVGTNVAYTKSFDQNTDFNTNGVFTAPVTGKYLFTTNAEIGALAAGNTSVYLILSTTANTFIISGTSSAQRDANNDLFVGGSVIAPMTAGDTAKMQILVFGGTKIVGLVTNANKTTFFSGAMLC